jgi:hypothetical protein
MAGKFAAWLGVSALLAISGCASLPMADPALDSAAKTFAVTPGKSKLYVYRNETFGAAVTMDVFIDGRALGQTVAQTYLVTEVDPGAHKLMGKAENEDLLDLTTVAGQIYYIWQEVKMGFMYGRTKLQLVDEKTGRAGVMESKLAVQPR